MASFLPAPIAPAMTGKPTLTTDARAPWFFLWVQQMLKWGDPLTFGVLIPFGILLILALIPYIFPKPADSDIGRWFPKSNRLAQIVVSLIAFIVILLTLLSLIQ
jgi:quinol-cytochrome oxidoreductase complex cytochrome b subunit